MDKEFVPYEEALALKELGFEEECFSFYTEERELYESEGWGYTQGKNVLGYEVLAPLYQQAFRWFREKYEALIIISNSNFLIEITLNGEFIRCGSTLKQNRLFKSYEEVELACLRKLIEIVKEK